MDVAINPRYGLPKKKFEKAGMPRSLKPQPPAGIDGGVRPGGVRKSTERFGIFFVSRCAGSLCLCPVHRGFGFWTAT